MDETFMIIEQDRTAATFIPLIQRYIRPGSTIFSDEWRAYNGIATIAGGNYTHRMVNHSQHFVDPVLPH
jgi:transposase-like protein